MTSRRERRLALVVVLVTAGLLRLAFAAARPDPGRFWDERYSFQNVAAMLAEGQGRPAHALYPSLSFLPHTAVLAVSEGLYRLTGAQGLAVFQDREAGVFSATAYRLSRGVSVLFGVWSLWLLYRLGSRVLDPAVALVATLLLATFWRHLRASGEFKPDVVVVALTLLSLGWSLEAARRESWPAFLRAGAGIGLATAAKYNAALAGLALVAAVALRGRGALRRLPALAAAAAASLAVFVLLNPWLPLVLRDVRWQRDYYLRAAARQGSDHWQVLAAEGGFFLRHHGAPVALCAAAGLLALAWRAARARPRRRKEVLALAAFAVGYPLLYAAATPLFLGQNMLPVVPLTCLFGAWTIVSAWRLAARRWPLLATPAARRTAFLALFLAAHRLPVTATYLETVPTTAQQAAALLAQELAPVDLRLAVYERVEDPLHALDGRYRLPIQAVTTLAGTDPSLVELADGEVFPGERLVGEDSQAYLRRLVRPGVTRRLRFSPRPFAARGRELVVVLHPWQELGPAQSLVLRAAGARRLTSRLDGLAAAGEVVSIRLAAPQSGDRLPVAGLRLEGHPLPLYRTGWTADGQAHFISQRRVLGPGPQRLTVVLAEAAEAAARPRAELHRWRPPGP